MNDFCNAWFHDTASALAYSLASGYANGSNPALQGPYNDLTQFIVSQQACMPDFLRLPLKLATLGFDLEGLFRTARLFHGRLPEVRANQIKAWKQSRSGFKRDL